MHIEKNYDSHTHTTVNSAFNDFIYHGWKLYYILDTYAFEERFWLEAKRAIYGKRLLLRSHVQIRLDFNHKVYTQTFLFKW